MNDYETHIRWMKLALAEAEKAHEFDETPVGAVIVSNGKIIGRGGNSADAAQSIQELSA